MSEKPSKFTIESAREMQARWMQFVQQEPEEDIVIPPKETGDDALNLVVKRTINSLQLVSYHVYIKGVENIEDRVGTFSCSAISGQGDVKMANSTIHEDKFRRRGIASAVYDLIDRDIRAIGGAGIAPHIGAQSPGAIGLWEKRRSGSDT